MALRLGPSAPLACLALCCLCGSSPPGRLGCMATSALCKAIATPLQDTRGDNVTQLLRPRHLQHSITRLLPAQLAAPRQGSATSATTPLAFAQHQPLVALPARGFTVPHTITPVRQSYLRCSMTSPRRSSRGFAHNMALVLMTCLVCSTATYAYRHKGHPCPPCRCSRTRQVSRLALSSAILGGVKPYSA